MPDLRQTRKNIKTDKFAEEIGHTFSFLTSHSDETKRARQFRDACASAL